MDDTASDTPTPTQEALWNGRAGQAWVDTQALLDRMFQPIEDLLVEAAAEGAPSRLLDVGCGTGGTTLAIARRLGARAHCTGLDISAPMIAAARDRAAREGSTACFLRADAQTHAFEPASVDRIVSRFGVMFFGDPTQAFANLRRAARADARLDFFAWRSADENPFMTTAERAAAPLLPALPTRRPDGPGQFAFADPDRTAALLRASGWTAVEARPIDVACSLPEDGLMPYLSLMGPVGALLQEADTTTRERVLDTVTAAFAPFVHGTEIRYTAACWRVTATATG